ncbi:MAG: signal peptidase II [Candidatus Marinimicrobia bacterium]|nr:signal peptidase II [Candidatus Neomarinimicrobiota bacterium]MCH7955638.1 signal peptidase II [Candidatus Neomarinimicrobiota bacterium]
MLKPLSISGLIVIFDQLTKNVVKARMELGESFDILGTFLKFTFVENKGLAFSIKVSNLGIFTGLSMVASLIVLYYIYKYKDEGAMVYMPLALIFGGAIGNMIDRVLYSKVVDFIDVGISSYRWPVFNIADSSVFIGLVWFLIASWRANDYIQEEVQGEVTD